MNSKLPQFLSGLSRALYLTTFLEMAVYKVHVMTCVLRTARISNVEIVMCVIYKERWETFQLGEEMKADVINMSRA